MPKKKKSTPADLSAWGCFFFFEDVRNAHQPQTGAATQRKAFEEGGLRRGMAEFLM